MATSAGSYYSLECAGYQARSVCFYYETMFRCTLREPNSETRGVGEQAGWRCPRAGRVDTCEVAPPLALPATRRSAHRDVGEPPPRPPASDACRTMTAPAHASSMPKQAFAARCFHLPRGMHAKGSAHDHIRSGFQGANAPGRGCRYRLDCQVPVPPAARTTCPQPAVPPRTLSPPFHAIAWGCGQLASGSGLACSPPPP
jgi:hypothetical protein